MRSTTPLADGGSVHFGRHFHVEALRGGMNRLLLRALPTDEHGERIEVLFQYVQYVDAPMSFEGLTIEDATDEERAAEPWSSVLVRFPECRVYRLISGGRVAGRVAAAACMHGADEEPPSAPSMFFLMG